MFEYMTAQETAKKGMYLCVGYSVYTKKNELKGFWILTEYV